MIKHHVDYQRLVVAMGPGKVDLVQVEIGNVAPDGFLNRWETELPCDEKFQTPTAQKIAVHRQGFV